MGKQTNDIFNTSIIDNTTKEQVYTSGLVNMQLAGWENFQDSLYTVANKRAVPNNTNVKVEFTQPVLFPKFDRQPRRGNTKFPIYDFANQKIISYEENDLCNCTMRFQIVAEATTNATGVGVEMSLTIPNYLTIYKESKALVKGTTAQRLTFVVPFYYDENTLLNGVEIYVKPIGDSVNFYDATVLLKNW